MKKWAKILLSVGFSLTLLIPMIAVGIAWAEGLSLHYVDSLSGYSCYFSDIRGEPRLLSEKEYAGERENLSLAIQHKMTNMFPERSPESGAFYFFFGQSVKPGRDWIDRHEVYVCCRWKDEEFTAEKNRLASLVGTNGTPPLFSQDLFPLPSLVFVYRSGRFDYTLFDESSAMVYYISLNEVGSLDDVVFDHSLAPSKPIRESDLASKVPLSGNFTC